MTNKEKFEDILDNSNYIFIEDSNLYYKLYMKKDTCHIVFRETSGTYKDWRINFKFLKVPYRGATWRAHRGFVHSYKSVQDTIHDFLQLHKPKHILIYGYSQGGAIAQLCYEDMRFTGYTIEQLEGSCSFAQPRVISWFGPKNRLKEFTRYVLPRDLVTKIPLVLMGYRHFGKKEKLQNTKIPFIPSIAQHYPHRYLKLL